MLLVAEKGEDSAWRPVLLRALWKLTKRRDLGDPWAKYNLDSFPERKATRRRMDLETMEWLEDTVRSVSVTAVCFLPLPPSMIIYYSQKPLIL